MFRYRPAIHVTLAMGANVDSLLWLVFVRWFLLHRILCEVKVCCCPSGMIALPASFLLSAIMS